MTIQRSNTSIPTGGITADAIDATLIADDAISEEHLDATAITGHTALAESPADTDEFLISDGGTLKRLDAQYVGGGALVRLGGSNSSSAAGTVVFDNIFTADYMFYKVFGRMEPSVNNYLIQMRLRTGGSSGSDSCNLGGGYLGYRYNNAYISGSTSNSCLGTMANNVKNDYWYNVIINFVQPYDSAFNTSILGTTVYREGSTNYYGFTNFGYQPDNTVSHTGFAIQLSTGNFNQTFSTIKVYGIVDS
jgi:hypothetical protein